MGEVSPQSSKALREHAKRHFIRRMWWVRSSKYKELWLLSGNAAKVKGSLEMVKEKR